jgi:hypothetical protein
VVEWSCLYRRPFDACRGGSDSDHRLGLRSDVTYDVLSSRLRETFWAKRAAGWHATPIDYDA